LLRCFSKGEGVRSRIQALLLPTKEPEKEVPNNKLAVNMNILLDDCACSLPRKLNVCYNFSFEVRASEKSNKNLSFWYEVCAFGVSQRIRDRMEGMKRIYIINHSILAVELCIFLILQDTWKNSM
jgi:hypothetical protein